MSNALKPPLIGITTYGRREASPFSLSGAYLDAIRAAGGIPVLLPPGESDPALLLDTLDGLIIPGGGDIDPSWYQGEPHPEIYSVDLERDEFELKLAEAALKLKLPFLGICRGMQIMIVLTGGTLIPHMPDENGNPILHRVDPEPGKRNPTAHMVQIRAESQLAKITQNTEISVVSWHHQGVRMVPAGWRVVAYAVEDRLIEAIEHQSHPWAIGVQWHPELSKNDPHHERIFQAFVEASKIRRGWTAA
ncbi:MAG: peptidase C26 [Leptolyngbya sp. ERB_1_1]